jgi:hypothetical protein
LFPLLIGAKAMKLIFIIASALALSACSVSAYAETPSTPKATPKTAAAATAKTGATAARKTGATSTKIDDCYGRPAMMSGKPCH